MPRSSSVASSSTRTLSLGSAMTPEAMTELHQAAQTAMAECRLIVQQAREMAQSARTMRADALRDTAAARKMGADARKIRAALKLPQH